MEAWGQPALCLCVLGYYLPPPPGACLQAAPLACEWGSGWWHWAAHCTCRIASLPALSGEGWGELTRVEVGEWPVGMVASCGGGQLAHRSSQFPACFRRSCRVGLPYCIAACAPHCCWHHHTALIKPPCCRCSCCCCCLPARSCVDRKAVELGLAGARTDYIQTDAAINRVSAWVDRVAQMGRGTGCIQTDAANNRVGSGVAGCGQTWARGWTVLECMGGQTKLPEPLSCSLATMALCVTPSTSHSNHVCLSMSLCAGQLWWPAGQLVRGGHWHLSHEGGGSR